MVGQEQEQEEQAQDKEGLSEGRIRRRMSKRKNSSRRCMSRRKMKQRKRSLRRRRRSRSNIICCRDARIGAFKMGQRLPEKQEEEATMVVAVLVMNCDGDGECQ